MWSLHVNFSIYKLYKNKTKRKKERKEENISHSIISSIFILPTWLSIHLKPTAAEHSFLEALVNQSRLYTVSIVFKIEETFSLLLPRENISPLELTLTWLFKNVSNHPLPDLCMDKITKNRTGLQAHSCLQIHQYL